ncbi:hypothetical protein [Rhizobium alvei]|uniref:Transmembrane protein n=1 Tax=Rhizobium alvei TaxID=1132659 RepID=A0ABT8YNX9_9HYPH|nr:hypothetical protein [Rhizobium alvei]MDO6965428.1 hypothetical protein [Rhizobium alvei]
MFGSKAAEASLTTLIIVQTVMLGALYAGVPPHPPQSTPLFAMAPFLALAISLAAAALIFRGANSRIFAWLGGLAAIAALVSFGPQKYFDPAIGGIWPAVVAGQVSATILLVSIVRENRRKPQGEAP